MTKDHSRVLLYLDPVAVAAELALGDCQQLTRFDVLIGLDADLAALDAARLDWSWPATPSTSAVSFRCP